MPRMQRQKTDGEFMQEAQKIPGQPRKLAVRDSSSLDVHLAGSVTPMREMLSPLRSPRARKRRRYPTQNGGCYQDHQKDIEEPNGSDIVLYCFHLGLHLPRKRLRMNGILFLFSVWRGKFVSPSGISFFVPIPNCGVQAGPAHFTSPKNRNPSCIRKHQKAMYIIRQNTTRITPVPS